MKLPNAERAVVEIAKLRDYSLNAKHPEGKHKARVFTATLGITASDASWLRDELRRVARELDCELGRHTEYGQRFLIDFTLTRQGKATRIRSAWIVRSGENFPRLTTCYVL